MQISSLMTLPQYTFSIQNITASNASLWDEWIGHRVFIAWCKSTVAVEDSS